MGQEYDKKSDFRCRRKPECTEKTYEVGYGWTTELTSEQHGDPGYQTWTEERVL